MTLKFLFQLLIYFLLSLPILAEADIDQWQDSDKTYYDLIQEGFEVKAYDTSKIETNKGFLFMFFVSVLQKENQVLSLNTKVAKTYCPDSLMTLYQHNNIVVIDENLEEVSSKTTFQNFLKGDKNNREETWKLFEYDILKVYDKVGGSL